MKKKTLKRNIINILILGWVVPVIILATLLAMFVDTKSNEQIQQTVYSSMDKAREIFQLEMNACANASKNASYYSEIRNAYNSYKESNNFRVFNNEADGFLSSEYKYNEVIKSAELTLTNEDILFYTYNNSAGATYKNVAYFKENVREEVLVRSEELNTKMSLISSGGNTYLIRNLMMPNFTPYAVLTLEINNPYFVKGFESVWGYKSAVLLLEDQYMMGSRHLLSEKVDFDIPTQPGNWFYRQKGSSFAVISFTQYGQLITAIVELDNRVLFQNVYSIWLIFAIILCALLPLSAVIFSFFRRNITQPIDVMVKAYEQVGSKNYGYQITGNATTKEFSYMQDSFNDMSHQIKEQFEEIYREEIALRDAKIMALQSQINPHFLNNTFEIINWEARLNGNIKVSKMIEALSTMLEATMNRHGEKFHKLAEEISYVDAYAYIISERLGDKFTYIKDIDESLLDVSVPKLIIQPIVENAVEHGLSQIKSGNITMRLYSEDDFVIIDIINDGIMSEEDFAKVKRLLTEDIDPQKEPSLSLGIRNVNNRIKLIYGDSCGLFMSNQDDKYTVSTIRIKRQ